MKSIALITAAGRGTRMGAEMPKQYLPLAGVPMLRHSILAFYKNPNIDAVCVVINEEDVALYEEAAAGLDLLPPVFGGETRQESVRNGLQSLVSYNPKHVLIHDAVRPFVSRLIVDGILSKLEDSQAVIPAIAVDDTIKKAIDGSILWTVERDDLWRAQTPQGFKFDTILKYHNIYSDVSLTDDSAVNEIAEIPVTMVPGSQNNFKITSPEDYERAKIMAAGQILNVKREFRVGSGYDVHAFNMSAGTGLKDVKIILGGVEMPFKFSLAGHSDADVVLHCLVDAILGAIGEDDIGLHFSDTDEKWKGANSEMFVKHTLTLSRKKSAKIINIDLTIICERPKISPYRMAIKANIARMLEIEPSRVNVKGKTNEKMGFLGRGEGIACQCVCGVEIDVFNEII